MDFFIISLLYYISSFLLIAKHVFFSKYPLLSLAYPPKIFRSPYTEQFGYQNSQSMVIYFGTGIGQCWANVHMVSIIIMILQYFIRVHFA